MTKKPRSLRAEEERLWQRVADTTTPLTNTQPKPRYSSKIKKPNDTPAPKPAPQLYKPPQFRVGEAAQTALPRMGGATGEQVRMDKRSFSRMKRGKTKPEARIDLHGMTATMAQAELTAFLLRSHDRGHRLVLVITGKGRRSDDQGPIPQRVGVLRQQLPHWTSIPP